MKKPTAERINTLIHNHMLGRVGMAGSHAAAQAILAEFGGEPDYPESFANQPKSILEERANRAKGQDPGPTFQDIFTDAPGWFEDDYEPSN